MIYGVLKGRGGNNSLMRVALSVRAHTCLPGGVWGLEKGWLWVWGVPEHCGCLQSLACPLGLRGNRLGWEGWSHPSERSKPSSGFQLSSPLRVS